MFPLPLRFSWCHIHSGEAPVHDWKQQIASPPTPHLCLLLPLSCWLVKLNLLTANPRKKKLWSFLIRFKETHVLSYSFLKPAHPVGNAKVDFTKKRLFTAIPCYISSHCVCAGARLPQRQHHVPLSSRLCPKRPPRPGMSPLALLFFVFNLQAECVPAGKSTARVLFSISCVRLNSLIYICLRRSFLVVLFL